MRSKTDVIQKQEQVLYKELVKYIELIAATRSSHLDDFVDYEKKCPAFFMAGISLNDVQTPLISHHVVSPATLHQEDLQAMDMEIIAGYGMPSIIAALFGQKIIETSEEIVLTANYIHQMKGGVGHA